MKFRVINNGNPTDPNNKVYEVAVEFFLRKLLKRKKIKDNVLRVDIKTHAKMNGYGECSTRKLKSGDVTVRVKFAHNITFIDAIITLAHECIHAEQFLTGKLRITRKKENWYWKNKLYGYDPYLGVDPYILPWEKEAYDKEEKLRKQFLDYYFENCLSY